MPSGSYDTACTSAAGQIATAWDAVADQYDCSLDFDGFDGVSTCDEYFDAYEALCEQVDGCVGGVDTGGAPPNACRRRRLSEISCTAALEEARDAMRSGLMSDSTCTRAAGQIDAAWDAVADQYDCSLDYGAFGSVSTCDEYVDAYATLCEQIDGCVGGSPCATVVVFVSIVEGTLGEPTAAEAVGTLQSLYASGELQQALAAVGITDELAGAPGLHIEPAGLVGDALILVIVLPIVGCLLGALLVVFCWRYRGKRAAAAAGVPVAEGIRVP